MVRHLYDDRGWGEIDNPVAPPPASSVRLHLALDSCGTVVPEAGVEHPVSASAAWPRAPQHRRGKLRNLVTLMLACAGALLIVGVGIWLGILAGRPHLTWDVRRSDNRVTIALAEGRGPFAGVLLSNSSVALGSRHGSTVSLTVTPGRTTMLWPTINSVWGTTERIAVQVPAQPSMVASSVDATSVTYRFSMPIAADSALCGLPAHAVMVTSVTFPRGAARCAGALEVVAASGERSRFSVWIPALPPPPSPPPAPPAPFEVFTANPDGGAFYITIDDGWYPSNDVLDLMHRDHLPITAFLISRAAATHLDYWKSFVAAGGDVEDHTVSHPNLAALSEGDAEAQWRVAAQSLAGSLGVTPTLGRPPYGDVNATVLTAAQRAGLRHVVMWSGYMLHGQLATQDRRPLHAGEIILLHWTAEVYTDLQRLLAVAAAQGLHPAPLAPALG